MAKCTRPLWGQNELFLIVVILKTVAADDCSFHGPDGIVDLSKLRNDNEDYEYDAQPEEQAIYILNVCRALLLGEGLCAPDKNAAGCQIWGFGTGQPVFVRMGSLNQMVATWEAGDLVLTYGGGIDSYGESRQLQVTFTCAAKAGIGVPVFMGEKPVHQYNFEWSTAAACPTTYPESGNSGGLSWGSVILICSGCAILVYFVAGGVWQWRKGERGSSIVIHREFWFSLPGLVKDGVLFIWHKLHGSDGYSSL